VGVSVNYFAPTTSSKTDPYQAASATCPDGNVNVVSTFSIVANSVKQGSTVVTNDPAGDSFTHTGKLRNWADLRITATTGPESTGQGQRHTYTATVENLGPCPATDVWVAFGNSTGLTYVDGSQSASCVNGNTNADETGFAETGACELGDLAKGQSATAGADFTVNTFPSDVTYSDVTVAFEATSEVQGSGATAIPATDDPNADNSAAGQAAPVDLSGNKGCSTGGAGGLLAGLLALAGLRLRRRR
jgi:uncharacterized repeat protein (TIGR01451 family)/MYXO-CTERM domain-containing protein